MWLDVSLYCGWVIAVLLYCYWGIAVLLLHGTTAVFVLAAAVCLCCTAAMWFVCT